jgi:hypothetical protein
LSNHSGLPYLFIFDSRQGKNSIIYIGIAGLVMTIRIYVYIGIRLVYINPTVLGRLKRINEEAVMAKKYPVFVSRGDHNYTSWIKIAFAGRGCQDV